MSILFALLAALSSAANLLSSVASGLLVQAALHVGRLTVSQTLLVVIDPIISIWLSVWLFAEYFTENAAVIAVAACVFASLIVGVAFLTQTTPGTTPGRDLPTRQPDRSRNQPVSGNRRKHGAAAE
jgi:hypothetical protein